MHKYRILLVDDEEDIRDCILSVAEKADLEFDQAPNGQAALEMILSTDYDCVVSDIKMPRMSGIEMLKALRHKGKDVPVVFISAFAAEDFAKEVCDYGAVKLLHKLEILKVRERIQEAIDFKAELQAIKKNADPMGDEFIQIFHKTGTGR